MSKLDALPNPSPKPQLNAAYIGDMAEILCDKLADNYLTNYRAPLTLEQRVAARAQVFDQSYTEIELTLTNLVHATQVLPIDPRLIDEHARMIAQQSAHD